MCWLTPQKLPKPRAVLTNAVGPQLNPESPTAVTETKCLSIHLLPPRVHLSGKWGWGHSWNLNQTL